LEKLGKKKWRQHVADVVARLAAALEPDDIVLGGGNVRKLKALPEGCRMGDNANAFAGGFRLWAGARKGKPLPRAKTTRTRTVRRKTARARTSRAGIRSR
jgi:polyphosphate glucokinase